MSRRSDELLAQVAALQAARREGQRPGRIASLLFEVKFLVSRKFRSRHETLARWPMSQNHREAAIRHFR